MTLQNESPKIPPYLGGVDPEVYRPLVPMGKPGELERVLEANQALSTLEIDGQDYPRVRFGEERHARDGDRCPVCTTPRGCIHLLFCPIDECPRCGGSLHYEDTCFCEPGLDVELYLDLMALGMGRERQRPSAIGPRTLGSGAEA
jgi:hypothetical protein